MRHDDDVTFAFAVLCLAGAVFFLCAMGIGLGLWLLK